LECILFHGFKCLFKNYRRLDTDEEDLNLNKMVSRVCKEQIMYVVSQFIETDMNFRFIEEMSKLIEPVFKF
jgi:hypothetical protein